MSQKTGLLSLLFGVIVTDDIALNLVFEGKRWLAPAFPSVPEGFRWHDRVAEREERGLIWSRNIPFGDPVLGGGH